MWKFKNGKQWCPHSDHNKKPYQPNSWRVVATKNGKRVFKRGFIGDKPRESGAIDFGKKLQALGYSNVSLISGRPFVKPLSVKVPKGMLWCPYCLKIREFVLRALRHPDGTRTPALWRCPVCHISIRDAFVRGNNDFLTIVLMDPRAQERKSKVPTEKKIRSNMAGRR